MGIRQLAGIIRAMYTQSQTCAQYHVCYLYTPQLKSRRELRDIGGKRAGVMCHYTCKLTDVVVAWGQFGRSTSIVIVLEWVK